MREAFTKLVQTAGDDNRRQAAQHHHRQHASQRNALIHMHQRRIANRQRDRPLAHAAGHNRQHDKEEDLERIHPQQTANSHADQHTDNFAAQHRQEDLQEPLNQRGAVHAHNAANDNAADVEIKNIGRFIEFGGGFNHHIRQQAVMDQRGRNKGGANRRRAKLTKYRQALAELAAGKTEEGQRRHHYHDIARQLAAKAVQRDKTAGQQK